MLLRTEQEESHAALKVQEITSVLMTQISGESSASSVDLNIQCKAVQHAAVQTHSHSHSSLKSVLCHILKLKMCV